MNISRIAIEPVGVAFIFILSLFPAVAMAQSLSDRIARGETFYLSFTGSGCPNDAGWTGSNDPMGTLKCGETYRVTYRGGEWSVTGYNEGAGKVGTWTYPNINPGQNQMNIWGRVYSFTNDGRVFDQQFGFVGYARTSGGSTPSDNTVGGGSTGSGKTNQPDVCKGISGTPRPPLSAGSEALQRWLRCNKI